MNEKEIGIIKQNLIKLLDASRCEGFYQARTLDVSLSDRSLIEYNNLRQISYMDRNDALLKIERILEREQS
jgi:hypothetical protein